LLYPVLKLVSTQPSTDSRSMEEKKKTTQDENPLMNIIINVIAPVLILSQMSKEHESLWHVGPEKAMYFALALPLGYGIWHFIKNKKLNIFSVVGVISVLLTGIITILIWNDPSLRPQAALLFGIKEAAQPLLLGSLFLLTHKAKTPLFNAFIYNDGIFDVKKIEKEVKAQEAGKEYNSLLWNSTLLFFGSFILSAILNMLVAYHFLGDLNPESDNWSVEYNSGVAAIMGWGFLVIGAPLLVIGGFIFFYLIKGLKKLTHFELEGLLHPR